MQYLKCEATSERDLIISPTEPQDRDSGEASGSFQIPQGHDAEEAVMHLKKTMQDEMLANPEHDFYVQINDNNLATYWVNS